MSSLPTACVIGAGSSGIAAVKALAHAGYDVTAYEKSDRVGGNWVWGNTNGMSSAYRSLHINTSRERMEYSDFPMPKSYPDFPHHTHIAEYFDAYVDHFGVRDRIRFETGVERAARRPDGVWEIALENGETHRYDALLVANGHHWDARWPEPAFPGADDFEGVQIHSHDYKGDDPDFFRDKTVVVLGMGNSAMDIAVEASFAAEHTYLAARRGAHMLPKYIFGRPIDQIGGSPRIPFAVRRKVAAGDAQGLPGRHGALRPAQARPPLRRRAPDRLRRHPLADGARHDHGEAEHRGADPRRRALHRRVGGQGRRRRLLHGLQGHVPVLRRGLHLRARQRPAAVPPHVPPRHPERVLHRAAAAARRDHADRRAPVDVGGRLPRRPLRAAVPGRRCGRTSSASGARCSSATSPPSATRCRSTSTTTSSRWRRSARRARSARGRRATGCPVPPARRAVAA